MSSPAAASDRGRPADRGHPEAEPALLLEGLERRWGERPVLHGLSGALPAGDTLAVVGANGAGKTTLLRVLAGLLRPHAGRLRILGHELPRERHALRGRVGLLSHEPGLYRELSPRENLRFHARLHRVGPGRVDALLERVGLERRADAPVGELSRGMVQRLGVCRCVLADPELLLLDEPLANLDPAAVRAVQELIGPEATREADGHPRTRVVVSHDPAGALSEADWVLALRAGSIGELRPAGGLRAAELADVYA